jgi:hypothetical protein
LLEVFWGVAGLALADDATIVATAKAAKRLERRCFMGVAFQQVCE